MSWQRTVPGRVVFPASTRTGEAWVTLNEGIHTVGHSDDSFHCDNEKPAHRALVGPVKVGRHLVTNAEWLAFINDGGYSTPTLWLMDGFAAASNDGWQAAGHWRQIDGEWRVVEVIRGGGVGDGGARLVGIELAHGVP